MSHTLQTKHKTTMVIALSSATEKVQPSYHLENAPTTGFFSRMHKWAWLAALLTVVGAGGYFRMQNTADSAEVPVDTQPIAREVHVSMPAKAASGELVLPATIQPYQATDLYARANGFLKSWNVDIGAAVKKGQVLAEIETPELDQELAQSAALLKQGHAEHQQSIAELEEAKAEVSLAEANIAKAKANVDYAVSVSNRSKALLNRQAISREEYENSLRDRDARAAELESAKADWSRRKANLGTRQAIIQSKASAIGNREANVQRLRDLTGFQKIVAPFDGIITRRNAEVGMLVTAGSNTGTRPLFSVAQVDVLRVQASVPQSSAAGMKAGDVALVTIPEKLSQPIAGKVSRTAGSVDPASRSLLVEVELPNTDGKILPGVYAQVRLQASNEEARWIIQTNTLLMRNNGPHVVIASSDNTLQIRKVTLGRDFGTSVEVLVGLQGRERLVVNPSDDLRDGLAVQVAAGTNP